VHRIHPGPRGSDGLTAAPPASPGRDGQRAVRRSLRRGAPAGQPGRKRIRPIEEVEVHGPRCESRSSAWANWRPRRSCRDSSTTEREGVRSHPGLMHVKIWAGTTSGTSRSRPRIDIDREKGGQGSRRRHRHLAEQHLHVAKVPEERHHRAARMTHDGLGKYLSKINPTKAPGLDRRHRPAAAGHADDVVVEYLPVVPRRRPSGTSSRCSRAGCRVP